MRAVIVGAGISGLSCAQLLLRAGYEVAVVSGDPLRSTTSHLAPAVWFPTAVGPPASVARWGSITFKLLAAAAMAGVPGVIMRESRVLYRDDPPIERPLPEWANAVGDVREASPAELPPGYPRGLRFAVPLVEMPTYLPHLRDQVIRAGAAYLARRINSLDELLDGSRIVDPRRGTPWRPRVRAPTVEGLHPRRHLGCRHLGH